jgi:hypothetical protein
MAAPPADRFHSKTINSGGIIYRAQPGNTVCVAENSSFTGDSVVIPATITDAGATYRVTSVGKIAFHLNRTIKTVRFAPGSQVTEFAERAFQGCEVMTDLQIPATVTSLHPATFRRTPALVNVRVDGSAVFTVDGGIVFNRDKTRIVFGPRNKTGVVVIPGTVTAIGEYAFDGCESVTGFRFANSRAIADIGDGAFASTGITEFVIPPAVESFSGRSAGTLAHGARFPRDGFLQDCRKLAKITFEAGSTVKEIPESAFRSSIITELDIPKSVTRLSMQCFAKTRQLKTVRFEAGSALKTIETDAFYATGVEAITFPAGVDSIEPGQFFSSPALKTFGYTGRNAAYVVDGDIMFTADKATLLFSGRAIERVHIPASVEVIAAYAFYSCEQLAQVTFEAGSKLKKIDGYAFFGTGIQAIDIPDGVTKICENAFGKCQTFVQIIFGAGSKLDVLR